MANEQLWQLRKKADKIFEYNRWKSEHTDLFEDGVSETEARFKCR